MRPVQTLMLWLGGLQLLGVVVLVAAVLRGWDREPAAQPFAGSPRRALVALIAWGLCAAGIMVLALQ
ncbi:MAG TPA: hypothetical protein VFC13_19550 [Actinomycetes bacterium]|jgi:hypothetical protein|nr:hypothetical protein [Actinomycetes bacterium]